MARVSFRLRRDTAAGSDTIGVGSFTRGTTDWQGVAGVPEVLQDTDKALRSRNLIIAFDTAQESTFEATAVDYDTVQLTWSLSESPTNEDVISTSGLIGLVVRYSPTGFPDSAADGTLVFSSINPGDDEDLGNETIFHTGVPEGRWAYYTLFGRYYQNGGGYWYEKFASVEALVPNNYGSTMQLWKRIPQYYRERDNGDLYRFLDVFGFEADRTKTLMRNVYMSFSPEMTEVEGLAELSKLVGLEIGIDDIGVSRTRELIKDIGFLRQRKGTLDGIIGTLQALSGANATFEYDSVNEEWVSKIYAQRANLVGNPKLIGGQGVTWDIETNSVIPLIIDTSSGRLAVTNTDPANPNVTIALISKVAIPTEEGVNYYSSIEIDESETTPFMWLGFDFLSSPTVSTYPGLGAPADAYVGERPVWSKIATTTSQTQYPVLFFRFTGTGTVYFKEWMVEPYKYGEYFDGSSDFGGFLFGSNFNDYRWTGDTNASYSTLVVQRKRTEEVIKKIFDSILPVNLTFDKENKLFFDWIPGKI